MRNFKPKIWFLIVVVIAILAANDIFNYIVGKKNEKLLAKRSIFDLAIMKLDELNYLTERIDEKQNDYLARNSDSVISIIGSLRKQKFDLIIRVDSLFVKPEFKTLDLKKSMETINKSKSAYFRFLDSTNYLSQWLMLNKSRHFLLNTAIKDIEKQIEDNKIKIESQTKTNLALISYTDIIQSVFVILITLLIIYILQDNKKQKELVAQLNQLNATKDKFFSIIGHDLKNPFSVILGFSELLIKNIEKYPTEKIHEFVGNIYQTSKTAHELLENLLDWSILQTGKIEPNPQLVKANDIIKDAVELVSSSANQKNISLSSHLPIDLMIFADKNMIFTVLRNLITNAIKFTDTNGKIEIKTNANGKYVSISITDNGVGIEKNAIENLFNIGSKNSTPGTQGEKGTGLGLLLCKEMIELNNGKIEIESQVGLGTIFTLQIPIAHASKPETAQIKLINS